MLHLINTHVLVLIGEIYYAYIIAKITRTYVLPLFHIVRYCGAYYEVPLSPPWYKTTLNYSMIVKKYLNLKEQVGVLIPSYEICSLLDTKLARWSIASYVSTLACWHFVSIK